MQTLRDDITKVIDQFNGGLITRADAVKRLIEIADKFADDRREDRFDDYLQPD